MQRNLSSRTAFRRKWAKDRKGQVSAIATLFGLLILVSLIAELALAPLPAEEQNAGLDHLLELLNQLGELQSDILLEVDHPSIRMTLSDPISLGSDPIPPFGAASPSELSWSPDGSVSLDMATPTPPAFGNGGSLCSSTGWSNLSSTSIRCTSTTIDQCAPPLEQGFTQSSVSASFTISGSRSCAFLNISGTDDDVAVQDSGTLDGLDVAIVGSQDTVTFSQSASSASPQIVVEGDNDTVTVELTQSNAQGPNVVVEGVSDSVTLDFSASNVAATISLLGSEDSYQWGTTDSGSSDTFTTYLNGSTFPAGSCPYGNVSSSDSVGSFSGGSSSVTQYLDFENSVGYTTSPHQVGQGGGGHGRGRGGSGPSIWFSNSSEAASPSNCGPTLTGTSMSGFASAAGKIGISVLDTYLGPISLSLLGDAVVLGDPNGSSLIDPPPFNISLNSSGYSATITLVNFVGSSSSTAAGYSTAAVVTHLISETVVKTVLPVMIGGSIALANPVLNLSTQHPRAWTSYFDTLPTAALGGVVTCTPDCAPPPSDHYVSISAPLEVQSITIVEATIGISVE